MKKGLIFLMCSVSFLVTNPIFAMENDEVPEEKSLRKLELIKTEERDQETEGKGTLSIIPTPIIQLTLGGLSINELLQAFRLSKAMYNICNSDAIWKILTVKHSCIFDPRSSLSPKTNLREKLLRFSDQNKTYRITIAELQSFKSTCYPDPNFSISYIFSLGKNRFFQLTNTQVGPDRLEILDQDATVAFSWNPEGWYIPGNGKGPQGCFSAHFMVGNSGRGMKDVSSKAYEDRVMQDREVPGGACGNRFGIKKLDKEEKKTDGD